MSKKLLRWHRTANRRVRSALTKVILLAVSGFAIAQDLTINQSPLVLGGGARPNVFLMIDNSESMDREFQTDRHSIASFYWVPESRREVWGIEGRKPSPPGLMEGYTFGTGSCGGSRVTTFVHMFNSDNRSGGGCSVERSPIAAQIDWRFFSANQNFLYYDPSVDYEPWDGYPAASFTAARANPVAGTAGHSSPRNLSGFKYAQWQDTLGFEADENGQPKGPGSATLGSNGVVDLWDDYTLYQVDASQIELTRTFHDFNTITAAGECVRGEILANPPYQDCFGVTTEVELITGDTRDSYGRTVAETQQNIANWYQYHRRRIYAMKSAISWVLDQSANYQVSFDVLNSDSSRFFPAPPANANLAARMAHNSEIKQAFLADNELVRSTPLKRSLERVGNYYLGDLPGHNSPITSACQQNFALLFTDGRGNGEPPRSRLIGDNDKDGSLNRLADVARHFYVRDLSELENRVPTSSFNLNTHQHMVTLTISFGQTGELVDTDGDGWPNPPLTESDPWRLPGSDEVARAMDDLWHAAYNSRGAYMSARNRGELIKGLERFMVVIGQGSGSVVPLAASSTSLREGALLFRASFDSEKWSGELEAYEVGTSVTVSDTQKWSASQVLADQHFNRGRTILTARPDSEITSDEPHYNQGIAFRFPINFRSPLPSELTEKAALSLMRDAPAAAGAESESERDERYEEFGRKVLAYVRGKGDEEGEEGLFRDREHPLGDIVNSKARFVGDGSTSGAVNTKASYIEFLSSIEGREPMLYVGSNDGFLHGFSTRSGRELVAYMPASLIKNIPDLASKTYGHRFFVDGSPTIVDSEIALSPGSVPQWRTVLASGLGAGGRAIFALDITKPGEFSEATAEETVLWEFSERDDADMGYSYSAPQIVKLESGQWAAVFGNGFASREPAAEIKGSGEATLFILDLATGKLLRKISTGEGGADQPNGMATPVLIDTDSNGAVDTAYAGDLHGNLWKFDLSASAPSAWRIEQGTTTRPLPLFVTQDEQPISSQPTVAQHPEGLSGVMLYFGTGKYVELVDSEIDTQKTQALYGIWDKDVGESSVIAQASLLSQDILTQDMSRLRASEGHIVRTVSNRPIDWSRQRGWQLPLLPRTIGGHANSRNLGERQISAPQLRQGRVFFSTFQPLSDSCGSAGRSFLMQLNYSNGGQPQEPVFDLDGDGEFTDEDGVVAGVAQGGGALGAAILLRSGEDLSALASGWEKGVLQTPVKSRPTLFGRQSWRQLE